MFTKKHAKLSKQLLSMLLTLTLVLPLMPAAALAAETDTDDVLFISQTVASTQQVTAELSEADYAAASAEDAEILWKLVRTGSFMNPGKASDYISLQGEGEPYPNELDEIDLENVPEAYTAYLNISNVETTLSDGQMTLTFDVSPIISRQNPSAIHGNGGAYTDVSGYFELVAVVNGKEIVVHDNVEIRPYASFHSMWEVYDELQALAKKGDNNDATAKPYVSYQVMGQSSAGYDMPYLIVAKSSEAVENWLELCGLAETDPAALQAKIADGTIGEYQVPVMYSNIHSNETAAVDGIMNLANLLVNETEITYKDLTALTAAGEEKLAAQREKMGLHTSELIEPSFLGAIVPTASEDGSQRSGIVEGFEDYYTQETKTVKVADLLEEVFFILVPEENVDGRINLTRAASNGYDLNRDNSFQTTPETQNMQHLIGSYNPVTLLELHGQVVTFQVEPCSPPHEPNFEYDLLSEHLLAGGEAFGAAAVANNDLYQSYAVPMRDYLTSDENGDPYWQYPWDDMSTSYTPQFAMMQGTVAYTVELPAYSEATTDAATYGLLGLSAYVAKEKNSYFDAQLEIYARCINNTNSDAEVAPWLVDAKDNIGAEADLFRPAYDGAGENGQFFPEAYIIPLDGKNQSNLDAAFDMIEWLTRNDVKVGITDKAFSYNGTDYPAGTMIVSMYQAKRAVANGVLYDGTVIRNWTELYSEGITAFDHTRGFDMITVAEPAAYTAIAKAVGTTLDYETGMEYLEDNAASAFSGVKDAHVIISNTSEEAAAAVNELLENGKVVGMITAQNNKFYGSFVCGYADWLTVADTHIITGTGLAAADVPAAQVITKLPIVYITGTATAYSDAAAGAVRNPLISSSYSWNYDDEALKLMGFQTTKNAAEADVIVGATALDADGLEAVKNGTPYIGYSSGAYKTVNEQLIAIGRASTDGMDCLGYVTYPNSTMINSSYIAEGDDLLYGYGTYYFTELPKGAVTLVKGDASRYPLEGFLNGSEESFQAFLNGIKGFAYEGMDKNGNTIDIALFANTLTNKVHQRDEYAYISNFIFSNLLGGGYSTCENGTACDLTKFTDVDMQAWYHDVLENAVEQGLLTGTSMTTIEPESSMTRAMLVTVLYRMEGTPAVSGEMPFADAAAGTWYSDAVLWAYQNEIVTGTSATTFEPDTNISREQLAAILWRYAKAKGVDVSVGEDTNILSYTDAMTASEYAIPALQWACGEGIMNGSNGALKHHDNATRAEAAAMLVRYQNTAN